MAELWVRIRNPQRRRSAISPHHRAPKVLIVEPDETYRKLLVGTAEEHAPTEAVGNFQAAYAWITTAPPTLLITNLRLYANVEGLHLAYVVASAEYPTRVVVYSDGIGPWVAQELQRIGAFFEPQFRLVFALPSYIQAELPLLDRRTPGMPDRRSAYRGGRRASDVPLMIPRF